VSTRFVTSVAAGRLTFLFETITRALMKCGDIIVVRSGSDYDKELCMYWGSGWAASGERKERTEKTGDNAETQS